MGKCCGGRLGENVMRGGGGGGAGEKAQQEHEGLAGLQFMQGLEGCLFMC